MGPGRIVLGLLAVGFCFVPADSQVAATTTAYPAVPTVERVLADVDETGVDFFVSLKYAIDDRDGDFFRSLLKAYIEVKGQDTRRLNELQEDLFRLPQYSLLHYACWIKSKDPPYGDKVDHVQALLDAGADVNLQTGQAIRPIHVASAHGNVRVLKALISRKADPYVFSISNMSPHTMAARGAHLEALYAFKDAGGEYESMLQERDLTPREPFNKPWNPLCYAVSVGNTEMIRFLIFEVGWGQVPLEEVVALAQHEKNMSEEFITQLNELSNPNTQAFKENRKAYFKANPSRKKAKKQKAKAVGEL